MRSEDTRMQPTHDLHVGGQLQQSRGRQLREAEGLASERLGGLLRQRHAHTFASEDQRVKAAARRGGGRLTSSTRASDCARPVLPWQSTDMWTCFKRTVLTKPRRLSWLHSSD